MTLIADFQPDLIHAGPVQGPAFLAALVGFHPLVTMSWGYDMLLDAQRSPFMRYATQSTLNRTDIMIADCQAVADRVLTFGFPAENIVQFPWGVDLAHFSPEKGKDNRLAWRRSLGWEENFVLLCNRSWSPKYGVDVLARAFLGAAQQNPDLRLLLVGSGPQAEELRRILTPVEDMVHMPGWVDQADLPAAYCAADLFITPSHCDGSSVSLLEALACGVPALVSDIPSNLEWVKPGVNGDVFPDGDAAALQEKILVLAADADLSAYARQARLIAEQRANWGENFQKLLQAYQRAVSEFSGCSPSVS
jgi:glycosyltransferase involved in cell wall biosynthesis